MNVSESTRHDHSHNAGSSERRNLISIVVPVLNEEENVDRLYAAVIDALAPESERYDFEFVFTDNHSTDSTFEKLRALAAVDPRVRIFRFSRNYGYQLSIYTGFTLARGAAAVQLDADLQDPPALIRQFLRLWEDGYRVVYGVRETRKEGWLITLIRRIFYRFLNALSDDDLPPNAGDFRLIDRRIIEELKSIRDPNIYVRGRISCMGFRQIGLSYDRHERKSGKSKFNFAKMTALAIDAVTSHSVVPLRFATYLGAAITLVASAMAVVYIAGYYFFGADWPPGFATLSVLVTLSMGLNGILLGVFGEYLARVHQHLKLSPTPIIETRVDQMEAHRETTTHDLASNSMSRIEENSSHKT
jgi:dolichol-phosphate mannosyltransferase